MSTGLSMDQDFTADKTALLHGLAKYNGSDETGLRQRRDRDNGRHRDDTSTFAADDSEYNSLNTDRELLAIRAIAKVAGARGPAQVDALLLRRPDAQRHRKPGQPARGHQRSREGEPRHLLGGHARSAGAAAGGRCQQGLAARELRLQRRSGHGAASTPTSARRRRSARSRPTPAGSSSSDSNDFGPAFQQVQHDTEAYYILGFHSTNTARDGSFRRLTVKVNRSDVKLEYRPGYYAPADFQHQKTEDRELALTEQMRSDIPATDVAVYLQALYFRQSESNFFVPVSA